VLGERAQHASLDLDGQMRQGGQVKKSLPLATFESELGGPFLDLIQGRRSAAGDDVENLPIGTSDRLFSPGFN